MLVHGVVALKSILLLATVLGTAVAEPHAPQGRESHVTYKQRQVTSGPNGYTFDVLHHLTGTAPYFDSPGVQLDPAPPQGCEVTKGTYLVRHSNTYARAFDYDTFLAPFASKLANFTDRPSFLKVPKLAFLADWTLPITDPTKQVDQLTPSGTQSAAAFGSVVSKLYPSLAPFKESKGSFKVWAASAQMCIDSARAFMQAAFPHGGSELVEVSESEDAGANTLVPHESCPNLSPFAGGVQADGYLAIYAAPIIRRFHRAIPSFNFTLFDIVAMQQLCGYETVARGSSDFCSAFEVLDWLKFEYANDLMFFYGTGYGTDIGVSIGLPWVDASASLLASSKSSQNLYISFTHREELSLVVTALGLFNNSAYEPSLDVNSTMSPFDVNYNRQWRTSNILPFLGRIALERLECSSNAVSEESTVSQAEMGSGKSITFIRAQVNGSPVPFPTCQDGPGASCALEDFMSGVRARVQQYPKFDQACGTNATAKNELTIYN